MKTIDMSTFNENDTFRIYYGENQFVELTLVKISKSKFVIANSTREGFSLMFKGAKAFQLEQGIHEMYHEENGMFDIALVPIMAPYGENEMNYYEAVFN